ncbi:hypothetical protein MsAm2_13690 [Methanolapillus ohkumae]|uniref:Uncharacterized protein n=1 Tax=Methanolapillus ohkumae TaxID=3028298 RepID=A0AA96V6D8_9EURY|nr:hypothetical protein MsAm2_13690 [Methanosarcinaceae archaeon Am2]
MDLTYESIYSLVEAGFIFLFIVGIISFALYILIKRMIQKERKK